MSKPMENERSFVSLIFVQQELGEAPSVIIEMLILLKSSLLEFETSFYSNESPQSIRLSIHKIKPSLLMFELNHLFSTVTQAENELESKSNSPYISHKIQKNISRQISCIVDEIEHLIKKHIKNK